MSSAAAFMEMPGGKCCAVKIEQTVTGVKLLFKHTGQAAGFKDSLAGIDLSPSKTRTVVGIDPPGIAFYNIEIPIVPDAQLDSVVKMQAETILPLPLGQMEIAYHCGRVVADRCRVTIAAGRSEQLSSEMAFAKRCNASGIVLNTQGMAKAFDTLFDIPLQRYIILNVRQIDTQVLLCEDGKLAHAARLDIGIDDLSDSGIRFGEKFIYDLRNALGIFGIGGTDDTTMYVFSKSKQLTETIVAGLNDEQMYARSAKLKPNAIIGDNFSDEEEVYEYLDPIGCALLSLDEDNRPLDLFGELYNIDKKKKKASGLLPLIRAAAIFVVMLVITFFMFNYLNKIELAKYENENIDKLVRQQNIRKLIARQRPDIIDLVTQINKDAPGGMKINAISFKKGEKASISSHASNWDEITKIQKFLAEKKDFSDVNLQNPTFDQKTKKYAFKINFHYKDWTRRSVR